MCTSENEQKQWIAKLSKKIPKRGIVSQHDQTTSSRFVLITFYQHLRFSKSHRAEKYTCLYPQGKARNGFYQTHQHHPDILRLISFENAASILEI